MHRVNQCSSLLGKGLFETNAATISAVNSTGFNFAILEFSRNRMCCAHAYARPVGSSIGGFLPAEP